MGIYPGLLQLIDLSYYDNNGNMTQDGNYAIAYTSFNKVSSITVPSDGGVTVAAYSYDAEHNRVQQTSNLSGATVTTTYLPGADLVASASGNVWHTYIMAEGSTAGEVQRTVPAGGTATVAPLYYFRGCPRSGRAFRIDIPTRASVAISS